jgi:hypothetical protein
VERVHGLRRVDVEVEAVAGFRIEDRDRDAVGIRLPKQCDLETVARSEVQLSCPLARHASLLSPLHHGRSVPSRPRGRYPADWRLPTRRSRFAWFGKSNPDETKAARGEAAFACGRRVALCGLRELLGQVALDQRVRELLLTVHDLEAVTLELGPARAAVAERLALGN